VASDCTFCRLLDLDCGMTSEERELLVRDARALIARYEEEFVDTWLDGMLSMLRRLADVVEEDGKYPSNE
jgi:hypothetical protein